MGEEDFPVGPEADPPPHEATADERLEGGLIQPNKHRALQVTRTGERKLFDKPARKAFLEWFAATGNVVWSAGKVGFSDKTVWRHRMNDPRFAEAFDRAFEQSLMRNKARMVERKAKEGPIALDGGSGRRSSRIATWRRRGPAKAGAQDPALLAAVPPVPGERRLSGPFRHS